LSRALRARAIFSGGFNIYKISAKIFLGVLLFTKFEQILIWGVMSRGGGLIVTAWYSLMSGFVEKIQGKY